MGKTIRRTHTILITARHNYRDPFPKNDLRSLFDSDRGMVIAREVPQNYNDNILPGCIGEKTADGSCATDGGEEFESERRAIVPVGRRGISLGQEEGTGQLGRKIRGVTCL